MSIKEAIDIRRSSRRYKLTVIETAKIEKLDELIQEYNKKENLNIQLIQNDGSAFGGLRKSYGMFSGVRNYIGLIENKNDLLSREKLGYCGELLVLHATDMELGTCWVAGSFDRSACPFKLSTDENIACVITLGYASAEEGMKEKLIRKYTHRKTKTAEEMFTADTKEVPEWFMNGMSAVQKAPSARNLQPVRFRYQEGKATAHLPDKPLETNSVNKIDLGIAKLHFQLGADDGFWEWGNGAAFHRY